MPGLGISRKSGESFTIGDDIVVTVVEAHGGTARLRIVAPKSLRVSRNDNGRVVVDEVHHYEKTTAVPQRTDDPGVTL